MFAPFLFLICIIAAVLMHAKGHVIFTMVAIITAIGFFWSWGVMHNYATKLAKRRRSYKGSFYDFNLVEVEAVPNWITWINMGFSLLGGILLIAGIML